MKIRNSSRIMALVLALMMIVPLIGVPTFAEDAQAPASNLLWSEDLEDYTADADLVVDSSFTTVKGKPVIKEADGNKYVHLTYGDDNKDKDFRVNGVALSYETTPVVVLSADYYVSSEATGQTLSQFRYLKNSGAEKGFFNLYSIQPSLGVIRGAASSNYAVAFPLDQWNNVKVVIDMASGDFALYVNGLLGAEWNSGYTNLSVDANNWIISKLDTSTSVTYTGYSCVDNIAIYNSTDGMGLKLWEEKFDDATQASDVLTNIPLSATIETLADGNKVLQHKIEAKHTSDYFLYASQNVYGVINNAVVNPSTGLLTGTASLKYNSKNYTFTVNASTINADTNAPTTKANVTETTSNGGAPDLYVVKGTFISAYSGGGNVAGAGTRVKNPSIASTKHNVVTLSAKYFFSKDATKNIEVRLYGQDANDLDTSGNPKNKPIDLFKLISDTNGTKLTWHADARTALFQSEMYLPKAEWFDVDVVLDLTNAKITVFVNGIFVFQAQDTDIKGELTLNANTWGLTMIARGNKDATSLKGYVQVDDAAIYVGDRGLKATTDYNYENTFDGTLGEEPADGFFDVALAKSTVKNNYGSNAWNIKLEEDDTIINKNPKLFTPQLSYTNFESIIVEADYFIESAAKGQLQSQFYGATGFAENATKAKDINSSWTSLYRIKFTGGANATLIDTGAETNPTMTTGEWHRIASVVNLKTGVRDTYVDGVKVGSSELADGYTNFTVLASQIIIGKVNNGQSAYAGNVQIDNIKVYSGSTPSATAPSTIAPSWVENFDDWTEINAYSKPSSATLVDGLSGKGIQIDIAPVESREENSAGYNFVYYNSRAINIDTSVAEGVTTAGSGKVALQDDTDPTIFYGFTSDYYSSIKFTKSEDGKKITVLATHAYKNANDKAAAYPEADRTLANMQAIYGAEDGGWTSVSVDLDVRNSLAYLEMYGVIPANLDKQLKLYNNPFSTSKYTKVVLETKFFVSTDAKGTLESQFYASGYQQLYGINATNGTLNGTAFEKGKWNTVNIVIDVTKEEKGAVYLNNVYVGETTAALKADGITATEWIVMKVQKGTNIDNFGGTIIVDDVSISVLNEEDLVTVAIEKDGDKLNYVTYNGAQITKNFNFFKPDAEKLSAVYFDDEAYAELITMVDGASIRLGDAKPNDALAGATQTGIRFATTINNLALFNALKAMEEDTVKSVVFGTLIAPKDYVGEGEVTKALGEGKYLDVQANYGHYYDFDGVAGNTQFVGSITNVLEANIGRTFTARGYVEVTLLSGQVVTIYGGVVERSVKQVAAAALADPNASWTPEENDELTGYTNMADWVAPAN